LFISKVVDSMIFLWWIVRISTTHMGHMGQIMPYWMIVMQICNLLAYWRICMQWCNLPLSTMPVSIDRIVRNQLSVAREEARLFNCCTIGK
jgi:hypothetical protein